MDGKYRAPLRASAISCCPIQGVARQNQSSAWLGSVAVPKTMQNRKTITTRIDLEHCTGAKNAAIRRRAEQNIIG